MSSAHILIVEDEPGIVDNIEFVLQQEDFITSHASTISGARTKYASEQVDLIILDVSLPDDNGFDFCKELRRDSDVPIIFLTARSDVTDRIIGLELGADDYMVKPFSPRELSARVKAILRRQQRPLAEHPFEVDEQKRIIAYFAQPLKLVRYEFDILSLMIAHPGRVYTRSELMDAVWDEPSSSYDRTIDTHIKVLRTKLHAIRDDQSPIITHRGLGYSLKDEW
ncbi:MAG: two-component system response regulator CreB [Planctomycetes bacterium]|nr:two-component system response regulator CreB [Planctomycetota bacterium]